VRDLALAALSGVLLVLSFPKFGHPAVAWVALAPLLLTLVRGSLAAAIGLGWTTGVVFFAGTLYWVTQVMVVYGGLAPVVAVAVNAALVATLALFPAVFALILRRLVLALGPRALAIAPFAWVATELARTYVAGGFPWVLTGYSQVGVLPVAQLASVTGVYGVSALVVGVSAGLAVALVSTGPRRWGPAAVALALVAVVSGWGAWRVREGGLTRGGTPVRVGLVQGNVAQDEKWDASRAASIFERHLDLTRDLITAGATLIIWPESSMPFRFEEDPMADAVRQLARDRRVSILLGSNQVERGDPPRYYNAAFLVTDEGATGGVYRKMHLVPFGEYVPLRRVLFFASALVEAVSDFSAGEVLQLLPVGPHLASTAICYEVVYPALVRRGVREGSGLVTTITNDAWFGSTSAPHQHFAQAAMRAIENGRYLVRAANTGISGIVDPYGRVLQQSPIFESAALTGEVRWLDRQTAYTRSGDTFAYAATLGVLALLAAARRARPVSGAVVDRHVE
jgi:apolipoprotein N-acyltransferase